MSTRYKQAFNELGEERRQAVPSNLSTALTRTRFQTKESRHSKSEMVQYWEERKDWGWVDVPGHLKWNRKKRRLDFVERITEMLADLDPGSTFNPSTAWKAEKTRATEATNVPAETQNRKQNNKDKYREDNLRRMDLLSLTEQVTRIRNAVHGGSKSEVETKLLSMVREIKNVKCRAVLLIEILNYAYNEIYLKRKTDKKLLFDTLWAIDAVADTITEFSAPEADDKQLQVRRGAVATLVYDNFSRVEHLLRKARAVRDQETDLVKLQLVDMSDCLPPLSKFTYGFKLDSWQKQALTWIDQGKSVVICAPTSSGKTVISSYVAVIFKATEVTAVERDENDSSDSDEDQEEEEEDEEKEDGDKEGEEERERNDTQNGQDEDALEKRFQAEMALQKKVTREVSQDSHAEKMNADASEGRHRDNIERQLLVSHDRIRRQKFHSVRKSLQENRFEVQRVLFIVPSEPLVWQVAAYFSKLLRAEGDRETKVAIITQQLNYNPHGNPPKYESFNKMPQIVVGTPQATESALSKPRGLVGEYETYGKSSGVIIPGGFDHFDWVIYDEVHSLDGPEGDALQRLIRAMNCKFLALSATVGNAEELRGWMEKVKGEQINGLETINVSTSDQDQSVKISATMPPLPPSESAEVKYLEHQVRFINLQRYIWNNSKNVLQTVSPIAAIDSLEALQQGLLDKSSLSFTSQDSYRLWEEIRKLYPLSDPLVSGMDPKVFFGEKERITLQRTKDYEDHLKAGLKQLASLYPRETQELIFSNQVLDMPSKEFDLCELVLQLKANDMLPCLPFHLNTFEAIKLFQHLLAGLEWRQKRDYPTFHLDKEHEMNVAIKANEAKAKTAGKNAKELEEMKKHNEFEEVGAVGTGDQFEPHPKYIFSNKAPLSSPELEDLSDEMERSDGFTSRDRETMKTARGKNETILKHALIRGLRRGIGLFIDEVSFPAYRRCVQKLASKGRLAVVISDDSLAFGVNMPFRTCVFCGEMSGKLDELMAQQMSGRAGRRGLDTQGNLVYAGLTVSHIRKLMIGTVSNITGEKKDPRYATVFLSGILSPRYVGWDRSEIIGGQTLNEFIHNSPGLDMFTFGVSKNIMLRLGFVVQEPTVQDGVENAVARYVPNEAGQITYSLLSVMWELRANVPESISLGLLFPSIIEYFDPIVSNIPFSERKQNADQMEQHVVGFIVILLVIIDRTPYQGEGYVKLTELPFFSPDRNLHHWELLQVWLKKYAEVQAGLPDTDLLRDKCVPGTELDGTLFNCLFDRHYIYTLKDEVKQVMKEKIWRVGNIMKIITNYTWPEPSYYRLEHFILRAVFKRIKYLNSELIHRVIDFTDVSSFEYEARSDSVERMERSERAMPWKDNDFVEVSTILPNPWSIAIGEAIRRYRMSSGEIRAADSSLPADKLAHSLRVECMRIVTIFKYLQGGDLALVQILADGNPKDKSFPTQLGKAIEQCSFVKELQRRYGESEEHLHQGRIGVLEWVCSRWDVSLQSKFVLYLRAMYDEDLISEEAVHSWNKSAYSENVKFIPSESNDYELTQIALSNMTLQNHSSDGGKLDGNVSRDDLVVVSGGGKAASAGHVVSEEQVVTLKRSSKIFIDWLEQAADEEEDDGEEDEEEEEEEDE